MNLRIDAIPANQAKTNPDRRRLATRFLEPMPAVALLSVFIGQLIPISPGLVALTISLFGIGSALFSIRFGVSMLVIGGVFLAAALVSSIGVDGNTGALGYSARAVLIFLALASVPTVAQAGYGLTLLKYVLFGCIVLSAVAAIAGLRVVAFSNHLTSNYSNGQGGIRASGLFYSPNELGLVSAVLVSTTAIIVSRTRGDERKLWLFATALGLVTLIASQSRSSILALALVGVLMLLIYAAKNPGLGSFTIVSIVLCCSAYVYTTPLYFGSREIAGRDQGGSVDFRQKVRELLWSRLLDQDGVNQFGAGLTNGNQLPANQFTRGVSNVDNAFFYSLAAFGIIATVALLLLLIRTFVITWLFNGAAATAPVLVFLFVSVYENSIAWLSVLVCLLASAQIGGSFAKPTNH